MVLACRARCPHIADMKYKDYYRILGVARYVGADDLKKDYRRLARKYHPDVSKEAGAEDKFKEIAEAYEALKDPDKRSAYDRLGSHQPGQEFRPPPEWESQFGHAQGGFEDIDLSDLFAGLRRGGQRAGRAGAAIAVPGEDYEVMAHIGLDDAYRGTLVDLELNMPEYDASGRLRRVARTFKARIPKGATDGQRLRLPGKGGKGLNGGRDGDLYLNIALHPHRLFKVSGHDLYLDLPLAPWEAVLGASVEVPTLGGPVLLTVPAGTHAGQRLRLAGRGLPKSRGGEGDLFAIAQIVVPTAAGEADQALYRQLAQASKFDPRAHFGTEAGNESQAH